MRRRLALSLVLALAALLAPLGAAPINIEGVPCVTVGTPPGCEGNGFFTATLDYSFANASTGTLQVNITNSASTLPGGKLVALAFNNPGDLITGVTVTTATGLTNVLGGPTFQDTISASPLDNFDIGASTSASFLGSGSPSTGLSVGDTGTLQFNLTGSGLNTLTTQSFVNALNTSGDFFAVRFRGFTNGGSDKVRAMVSAVPEPRYYALLFAGIALVSAVARMRKTRVA